MKTAKYIIFGLIGFTALSCSKFEEFNEDTKKPTEVEGNALFSNAQKAMCDQVASTNVNRNVFRLFSQYWTETTYTDESNYNVTTRAIPDFAWRTWYRDILMDLKEAKRVIGTETPVLASDIAAQTNRMAITEILSVYGYQRLVDLFGNIPYDAALDPGNVLPVYEDAQTVYGKLFARLDAAIAALNTAEGSFGSADLIYGGDVSLWRKFANSLKVKMAITVADVPALNSAAHITAAVADGVFGSLADNAAFQYLSTTPNTNPLYVDLVASGRKDFVPANTLVDLMNNLNDPRRDDYFDGNLTDSVGNVYYSGGIYAASNNYAAYTHISPTIQDPTFELLLLDYTEIQFYLAEAVERGLIGGSAEVFYNAGIDASVEYWGGTSAEALAYRAQTNVAYLTAPGTYKEKIGTQAWLAFYNRGFIGWTSWRRLDAPTFNPPSGMTNADIPVRYTYSGAEQTLNGSSYTAAAAAIGGDYLTTKLFWDLY